MPDPSWFHIRQYLGHALEVAQAELAEARSIEDIWRCQGKVQILKSLQHMDQALVLTADPKKD